ncbi:hypothetical protein WA026_007030 [Henosepilachna vigintioctopunctata]|uniref:60S ribosomal protein L21 n=1 Tax=Henosepilachna vigintioctopunctata TaxID=420089 RepID=A0AAW1VBH7_9CUCU
MKVYKVGDIVDINGNGTVQKVMAYNAYHGRTGRVFNVTANALGVIRVSIRVVKTNEKLRKEAKEEGSYVNLRRLPKQPRPNHIAVKLESIHPGRTRYLVVVSRMGSRGEESCLLGIDCNEKTTVGLVLRVLADTSIRLDGDGGFSVSVCGRHHIFKPVSVQAMWLRLNSYECVFAYCDLCNEKTEHSATRFSHHSQAELRQILRTHACACGSLVRLAKHTNELVVHVG